MSATAKICPGVFIRAAEYIDTGTRDYACHAIQHADGFRGEIARFHSLFYSSELDTTGWTGNHSAYFCRGFQFEQAPGESLGTAQSRVEGQRRAHRVFALLLAYEITRDEALRARWRKNSKAYRTRKAAAPKWREMEVGEVAKPGDELNARANMLAGYSNAAQNQLDADSLSAGWISVRESERITAFDSAFLCYRTRRPKGGA